VSIHAEWCKLDYDECQAAKFIGPLPPFIISVYEAATGKHGSMVMTNYNHGCPFFHEFIWSEGNYSCSCNRSDFGGFERENDHCGDGEIEYPVSVSVGGVVAYEDSNYVQSTPRNEGEPSE
jgi:hypothetical protein